MAKLPSDSLVTDGMPSREPSGLLVRALPSIAILSVVSVFHVPPAIE